MALPAETFLLTGAKIEAYARRMKKFYPRGRLDVLELTAAAYFDWFRRTHGRSARR